eukprot:GHVU01076103.1.p1 GENE.GHVU01076103.1~~GHVU01076103.1.p1  ORF type:complete len:116 (-),score=0.49 GHVU01076103.1:368-715(-)
MMKAAIGTPGAFARWGANNDYVHLIFQVKSRCQDGLTLIGRLHGCGTLIFIVGPILSEISEIVVDLKSASELSTFFNKTIIVLSHNLEGQPHNLVFHSGHYGFGKELSCHKRNKK